MSLGLDETTGQKIESELEVNRHYHTLRIIWLAILATVITLFIVTRVVPPSTSGSSNILAWSLLSLGLVTFLCSFILKHALLKQSIEKRKPDLARSAYIIAFALCEATGIFGLVTHIVTGVQYYYLFFVLSGFGILLHKPERDDLLAAAAAGGSAWEARKTTDR